MAGSMLVRAWRLPERLAEIVGGHHDQTDDRDAGLVGLADGLARYAVGLPVSPLELRGAAKHAGITAMQLRGLMYDLPQEDRTPRPRVTQPTPLSPRQTEVLRELARGGTYKQIGSTLHLSSSTVRAHLHNTYRTLGVGDRAQAVLTATDHGWI
jgi:two-component system nitrate/nitrite response regulator NarL